MGIDTGICAERVQSPHHVKLYKEQGKERFLVSEEIKRLGEVLFEAETVELPSLTTSTDSKSEHVVKPGNQRVAHPGTILSRGQYP